MEPTSDIERHVAGATVTHDSPFADLEVPMLSEPFGLDFHKKWIAPFYRASLFRGAEEFAESLKPIYSELNSGLIVSLLSDFNWRPRITGAYFAAIRRDHSVQDHIGRLLLRSDVCFAGGGYCLAFARINTPEAIGFLSRYLEYYLGRPDLWFDQHDAIGALVELDRINGTNYMESFDQQLNEVRNARPDLTVERSVSRFRVQLEAIEFISRSVGK